MKAVTARTDVAVHYGGVSGLAIFITTLVINLIGNGLRDWLDPHMKL
jgi:ABC-type dipeptide/oligopeptide/nickel transport system permease subunit